MFILSPLMLGRSSSFRETTEGLSSLQQHRKVSLPLTRPPKVSSKAAFWPSFTGVKGDSVFRKWWCRKPTLCWRSVHQKSTYCDVIFVTREPVCIHAVSIFTEVLQKETPVYFIYSLIWTSLVVILCFEQMFSLNFYLFSSFLEHCLQSGALLQK